MPDITDFYSGSFDDTHFMELWSDGLTAPDYPVKARSTVVEYAGGGHGIKTSGLGAKRLELPVAATNDDMDDLESKVDSTGTLVYHRGSSGGWYLDEVRDRRVVGDGSDDACRAVLVLIK